MKLQRFFIQDADFSKKEVSISDAKLINQMRNVFRFKIGDQVMIINNSKKEATCNISNINKANINLKILKIMENKNESDVEVTLYISLLKKDKLEWAVQKATEIGVTKIVSIITKRTVKNNISLERLRKISQEAMEQSERGSVPEISEVLNLDEALQDSSQNETNVFFDRSGENIKQIRFLNFSKIGIFIGPEGGWDVSELEMIKNKNNFKLVSLGKTNLRAETAAIIASYLVVKNML